MVKRFRSISWLPYAPVWLAPFVLMAPAWLTGRAIFWGTPILQFVPWSAWAARTLASGHLPLWNPLVGMGAPLLANYQSALLYPPNWLLLLLAALGGAPLLAWGQALVIALHLGWAGTGMVKLTQRLGLGRPAGTISGLAFGLSGYLVARSAFLSINAAAAWLPWVMLGILEVALPQAHQEEAGTERRSRFPALLAVSLGMQFLAGHAQTTWYTLLLAGMWAIYWGARTSRGPSNNAEVQIDKDRTYSPAREMVRKLGVDRWAFLRPLALLAVAGSLAAGIAAVQLFPTAEYLLHSQRESGLEPDFALAYSFSPWHFLTLVLPDFFGNPGRGDFSGYANYWESAVYIGLLPFLLALVAVASSLGRKASPKERPFILFLLAVTLLSFALALGKNSPLYPWLYQHAPTFDMLVGPARWTLWAEFSLALLAGYGIQGWRRPQGRGLYWTRLGIAGAFAAAGGALLADRISRQANPTQVAAVAMAGVWAAGAGLLSLTAPRNANDIHPVWTWVVALWVCADLLVAHFLLNPAVPLDLYRSPAPQASEIQKNLDGGRLFLNKEDEYTIKFERFFLFNTYDPGEDWLNLRQVYLPNTAMLDGLPSANNFDPLVPARYARWMQYLGEADPSSLNRILPRMNVSLVERVDRAEPSGVSFTKIPSLGRARWVPCAVPVSSSEEAWQKAITEERASGLRDSFVILEGLDTDRKLACSPLDTGQAQIVQETPNKLVVDVKSSADGWLLLADMWYPGWKVTVDGKESSILRADYLFRAVKVPAGVHQVVFWYQPLSFWIGALISMLVCGAMLATGTRLKCFRLSWF